MKLGEALRVRFLVAVGVTAVGCGGGTKPMTPQCLLNSDCAKLSTPGLVCALGYCVTPCATSSDCPNSERCVVLSALSSADGGAGADAGVAQGTACQAPELATCNYTSMCKTPLVCSADHQCRDQCETNIDCPMGQFCTSVTHLCADPSIDKDYNATINDFVVGSAGTGGSTGTAGKGGTGTAGAGGSTGTAGKGSAGNGAGATAGSGATGTAGAQGNGGTTGAGGSSSCATSFGLIGQGDSNPNFQTGVGALGPNTMYIFTGYFAAPSGAGAGDPEVYVQSFDPKSGKSKGPSLPLFSPPLLGFNTTFGSGSQVQLLGAAVAQTGDIALAYSLNVHALYVAFLSPSTANDGGADGLQVQTIQLLSTTYDDIVGQATPRIIWSNSSQTFIVVYTAGNPEFLSLSKFTKDGHPAGGIGNIPTTPFSPTANQVSVGESGNLLGVEYFEYVVGGGAGNAGVALTTLDQSENVVGSPFELVSAPDLNSSLQVTSVAGTAKGFVCFYTPFSQLEFAELFVSTEPDAGVVSAPADGGVAALPGFTINAKVFDARTITDNVGMGGGGGVGVALLLDSGDVDFAYVNADGVGHQGPFQVFAGASEQGGEPYPLSMTNFNGSFAMAVYDHAKNSARVIETGICP